MNWRPSLTCFVRVTNDQRIIRIVNITVIGNHHTSQKISNFGCCLVFGLACINERAIVQYGVLIFRRGGHKKCVVPVLFSIFNVLRSVFDLVLSRFLAVV
jgi:hypothetical protein